MIGLLVTESWQNVVLALLAPLPFTSYCALPRTKETQTHTKRLITRNQKPKSTLTETNQRWACKQKSFRNSQSMILKKKALAISKSNKSKKFTNLACKQLNQPVSLFRKVMFWGSLDLMELGNLLCLRCLPWVKREPEAKSSFWMFLLLPTSWNKRSWDQKLE